MNVKEAVQSAKDYLADLYVGERITHVGLEEVEFNEMANSWSVTVGFSRPWNFPRNNVVNALGPGPVRCTYKVIRISDEDGRAISLKDRFPKDSE